VFQPNVRFFVAHLGDQAAGCGAVALFDGYAEVKRMYTREAARGRGVGKALLGRIEREARDASKPMLRLETGTLQAEAIGLYERCGFRTCGPFGHYAELPPHRIATAYSMKVAVAPHPNPLPERGEGECGPVLPRVPVPRATGRGTG